MAIETINGIKHVKVEPIPPKKLRKRALITEWDASVAFHPLVALDFYSRLKPRNQAIIREYIQGEIARYRERADAYEALLKYWAEQPA